MSSRTLGPILTLLSLAAFVACAVGMGMRAAAFNRDADFDRYRIAPTLARNLDDIHGRSATLTDYEDPDGRTFLRLQYGDHTELIPVQPPPARDVPELAAYSEWVSVQAIMLVGRDGERARDDAGNLIPPRYIIVTRHTPPGFDPESWGSVRRADWTFIFYELHADGRVTNEAFRFPRSQKGEDSLARRAAAPDAKPHETDLITLPPLEERTWQYQSALHVIPKLQVPKYRFENDAFSFRTMGWYLPGAAAATFGILAGLAITFAPRRVTA